MNAHNRFMAHRPNDAWLALREAIGKHPTSSELNDTFNNFVLNVNENGDARMDVDTLYTSLCIAYQTKMLSKAFKNLDYPFKFSALTKYNVIEIQNVLYTQQLNAEDLSLILDILTLHLALYSRLSDIIFYVKESQYSIHQHLTKDSQVEILDLKVMDCYMDSCFLHRQLYSTGQVDEGNFQVINTLIDDVIGLFRKNVRLWLEITNHQNIQLLPLLLPKFIEVIRTGITRGNIEISIHGEIWRTIMTLERDPGEILSVLYLTAGLWFPMDRLMKFHGWVFYSVDEELWLLFLKGLSSPIPQHRKEALFLIKRVVDFADKWKSDKRIVRKKAEIRLLCDTNLFVQQQKAFRKNLNNYFSVMEALEETEPLSLAPIFALLQTLRSETIEQQNDKTVLHIAWIRCAFLRILQHDNDSVVKEGLLYVLVLDPQLCNDELLDVVLNVLNNTDMYNTDPNDEEPTVVRGLTRFLNYHESKNTDMVTRFILKASRITWGPVALFYIIHALSMVKKVKSVWKEADLTAVRALAKMSSTIGCPMLRIGSQIELLELAMTDFATESLDLITVCNTLSAFSTNEALKRGQLAWERTSSWLSKLVKEDEAIRFLEKISLQVTNGDSQLDLSMKSFSLIIMLFYDARLILGSKLCPGIRALRNLLDCLIGTKSRSNANADLKNKSIELIHHLLDFISSEDCILCRLISNYADACLRFTFKSLRHVSENAVIENINTHILVTQQLFTADSSIIAKRDVLDHIDKFEIETRNIIEDDEWSDHVRRFFGIKILHACLKTKSAKLRNYRFIEPLSNTYRTLMERSSDETEKANKSRSGNENPQNAIASEYFEIVAKLFYAYLKDEPVDDWLPDIDWIEEVSYLIQVGGKDIFVPLVGILSQMFYKEATEIDDFKSVVRLCWMSTLESKECWVSTENILDLIFSSPFLEREETRELTIECTRDMVDRGETNPELRIIMLKGLKQVKGQYLCHFYDAILTCLLYGSVPDHERKIELQACSYVLDSYQDIYPNYLSNMNINKGAIARAHAVTLLYKMITDDPTHAVKLLPIVYAKLIESETNQDLEDSQLHRLQNRIMQVLLILKPMLEKDDIESLHTSLVLFKSSQSGVRVMQQWLLIRIYLAEEKLLPKLWDLFDQCQEERVDSLYSVITIVYHVALSLSSELQLDFVNSALQYIFSHCMSYKTNLRLHAQAVSSKLYDFASEKSYSTVTEKYKELYAALTRSSQRGMIVENIVKLEDDFFCTDFNAIDDYSLQTLFQELPRLLKASSDEYISPQMFEKFGFKESNSHPLKLLNSRKDGIEGAASVLNDSDDSGDCSNEVQGK